MSTFKLWLSRKWIIWYNYLNSNMTDRFLQKRWHQSPPPVGVFHCCQTHGANIQLTILKIANTPTIENRIVFRVSSAGTCRALARVVASFLADACYVQSRQTRKNAAKRFLNALRRRYKRRQNTTASHLFKICENSSQAQSAKTPTN